MKKLISAGFLVVSLAIPALAFAHEGMEHIKGTLSAVGDKTLTIETTEKKAVTVQYDEKTKFELDGKAVKATELKAGARVVVHAKEVKEVMTAVMVMVSNAAHDHKESATGNAMRPNAQLPGNQ